MRRIANYLEMPISENRVAGIVQATAFDAMKAAAGETGAHGHFTAEKDRDVKHLIQPYHIAMVNKITMIEMPDLAARLEKIGMPWLFDHRESR